MDIKAEVREMGDVHSTANHAQINHHPTKRKSQPGLLKVQSQTIRDQATRQTGNGNPDAMESILWLPAGC